VDVRARRHTSRGGGALEVALGIAKVGGRGCETFRVPALGCRYLVAVVFVDMRYGIDGVVPSLTARLWLAATTQS
jgi:hypothetical protein